MTEHHPLLDSFKELFSGREGYYGQYGDGAEKKIQTLKGTPSDDIWARHLSGEGPYLGMVPIRLDNTCLFGAIDVDDDNIDHKELAQHVKELRLPLVVCKSKSGGAHLYVFFQNPVPAPLVSKALKSWAVALGHKDNVDGRPVEIFPKQTALRPKDSGNWINLPYYGASTSKRKAVSVTGETLPLEEFIAIAEMLRVKDATELTLIQPATGDIFGEGPPCLQTLHVKGFAEGTRNSGLYNIAIFFKLAFPDDWQNRVAQYNLDNFAPALQPGEVTTVVTSVARKDYSYNCDELPIQPHCQKALCNKRKYGVLKLRSQRSTKAFPPMSALRKILTDPPRWIVNMGGKDVELTTDDITQLPRLRKVAFEKLDLVLPNIRPADYDEILRDLLATAEVIDAPEDAGVYGQFMSLVRQFLEKHKAAEAKEDLFHGLPFKDKDENLIFFRSQDLMSFLERRRFGKYAASEMFTVLRSSGADHKVVRTKKGLVRCWVMPAPKEEQTESFDPIPQERLGEKF